MPAKPCVQLNHAALQDNTIGMDIKLTGILSTSLLSCSKLRASMKINHAACRMAPLAWTSS
jgi:hypothetical protein